MTRTGNLLVPYADHNPQTGEVWWIGMREPRPVVFTRTLRGNWRWQRYVFNSAGELLAPTIRRSSLRIFARFGNHHLPRVEFTS
jgi:hypothetical protein